LVFVPAGASPVGISIQPVLCVWIDYGPAFGSDDQEKAGHSEHWKDHQPCDLHNKLRDPVMSI
jgi:hypothetical protein